jgi:hypothetical protein
MAVLEAAHRDPRVTPRRKPFEGALFEEVAAELRRVEQPVSQPGSGDKRADAACRKQTAST